MTKIIDEHAHIFEPLTGLPPRRGPYDCAIELIDPNVRPSKKKHYQMSTREKEALLDEIRRFKGYDSSYDLWMPIEEMTQAEELLQRYAAKNGLTTN